MTYRKEDRLMAEQKQMTAAEYREQVGIKAKRPGDIVRNTANRAAGADFEEKLLRACDHYRAIKWASVEKNEEPTRQISAMDGGGRFTAIYTKKAQGDYSGVLAGGRMLAFEAKSTRGDMLRQSAVTETQTDWMNEKEAFGAMCFVLVSMMGRLYFRVPWAEWRDMKEINGRKYVTAQDLMARGHEVPAAWTMQGEEVRFLQGVKVG